MQPGMSPGDTLPFFSNYWEFLAKYLKERLADEYVLSPGASLAMQTDNLAIPVQVGVHTLKSNQSIIQLPHGSSVAIYHDPIWYSMGVSVKMVFSSFQPRLRSARFFAPTHWNSKRP